MVLLANHLLSQAKKQGFFDKNSEHDEFAFYPPKTWALLMRPPKMTKVAGGTQARAWFTKSVFLGNTDLDVLCASSLYLNCEKPAVLADSPICAKKCRKSLTKLPLGTRTLPNQFTNNLGNEIMSGCSVLIPLGLLLRTHEHMELPKIIHVESKLGG